MRRGVCAPEISVSLSFNLRLSECEREVVLGLRQHPRPSTCFQNFRADLTVGLGWRRHEPLWSMLPHDSQNTPDRHTVAVAGYQPLQLGLLDEALIAPKGTCGFEDML